MALKSAGARLVFLVGPPGEREAELRQAGIDTFIYAGCDALATLQATHQALQ
jgi:methylmalonyl-CoA mutase